MPIFDWWISVEIHKVETAVPVVGVSCFLLSGPADRPFSDLGG